MTDRVSRAGDPTVAHGVGVEYAHNGNGNGNPNGNGALHGNGRSGPRLLRDYGTVECTDPVELVIFRFSSFGRLAHVRRWLQALPHVLTVRIVGYVNQTALFSITVAPGTTSGALVPPGTQLLSSDGRRIELCA